MIQRIQTVYLLLAAISLSLLYFISIGIFHTGNTVEQIILDFSIGEYGNWALVTAKILLPVHILLVIVQLAQFKNRKRQITFGKVNYLLSLTLLAVLFLGLTTSGDGTAFQFSFGAYLPLISLAFIFMANRAIKHDEKLGAFFRPIALKLFYSDQKIVRPDARDFRFASIVGSLPASRVVRSNYFTIHNYSPQCLGGHEIGFALVRCSNVHYSTKPTPL